MSKFVSNSLPSSKKLSSSRTYSCQVLAWLVSLGACALAVGVWGQQHAWHFTPLSSYQIFPVLGLLAFSLMWSHYIASVSRQFLGLEKGVLKKYFEATSLAVLVLICLHPGLLIYQRFRDGYGLPPGSYESYVRPGLGWVTLLGSVSFLVFIAYEFRRLYASRPWWRYMQFAVDGAMLAIFYHSLRLGDQLQMGWYRTVWWFYGITLVAALIYGYSKKYGALTQKLKKV